MLVSQNETVNDNEIQVTKVEEENLKICGCLSARRYSLLGAVLFAAMAYYGEEKLNFFANQVQMKVISNITLRDVITEEIINIRQPEYVHHLTNDSYSISYYPEYILWAMAAVHLCLVFESNPVVLNFVACLYHFGKWIFYAISAGLYYQLGYCMKEFYMVHFNYATEFINNQNRFDYMTETNFNGMIYFMWAIWCTTYGCMMSSIGDVYYQYRKDLKRQSVQEEKKH